MEVLKNKFDFKEIIKGEKVIIDFYADWCGPCKVMDSIIEDICLENDDIRIVKVNTDSFMTIARDYKILSIPAFKIFENGKVIKEKNGLMTREEFLSFIGK